MPGMTTTEVDTADLRAGDRLVNTSEMVVTGTPVAADDGTGTMLVPIEGAPKPIPFAPGVTWLIERTDTPTEEHQTP